MDTIIDLRILGDHPEELARVTQALGRAYFNSVLKSKDIKPLCDAYGKAFRFCPNYRLILKNKPGFEKYNHISQLYGEILSIPLSSYEPEAQASVARDGDSSTSVDNQKSELEGTKEIARARGEAINELQEEVNEYSRNLKNAVDNSGRILNEKYQLEKSLKEKEDEIRELREWKRSAIEVMSPIQEIGKAVNVKLGESIHDKILPAIQQLQSERDKWKALAEAAAAVIEIERTRASAERLGDRSGIEAAYEKYNTLKQQ